MWDFLGTKCKALLTCTEVQKANLGVKNQKVPQKRAFLFGESIVDNYELELLDEVQNEFSEFKNVTSSVINRLNRFERLNKFEKQLKETV